MIRDAFARITTSAGLQVIVAIARKTYQAGIKAAQAFRENEPILRDKLLPKLN